MKKITLLLAACLGLGAIWIYAQQTQIPSSFILSGWSYTLSETETDKDATTYRFKDIFKEGPSVIVIVPHQNNTPEDIKQAATNLYNECMEQNDVHRLCRLDYCGQNDIIVQTFEKKTLPSKTSTSKYGQGLRGLEREVEYVDLFRITPKGSMVWGAFALEDEDGIRHHPFGNYRSSLCKLNIL